MSNSNDILKAWLEQTKISNIDIEEETRKWQEQVYKDAVTRLSKANSVQISDSIEIPSKIKVSDIEQKTGVHDQMKNYDHSLEKKRSLQEGVSRKLTCFNCEMN